MVIIVQLTLNPFCKNLLNNNIANKPVYCIKYNDNNISSQLDKLKKYLQDKKSSIVYICRKLDLERISNEILHQKKRRIKIIVIMKSNMKF